MFNKNQSMGSKTPVLSLKTLCIFLYKQVRKIKVKVKVKVKQSRYRPGVVQSVPES